MSVVAQRPWEVNMSNKKVLDSVMRPYTHIVMASPEGAWPSRLADSAPVAGLDGHASLAMTRCGLRGPGQLRQGRADAGDVLRADAAAAADQRGAEADPAPDPAEIAVGVEVGAQLRHAVIGDGVLRLRREGV